MPDFLSGLNSAAPAILQALINATLLGVLLTLVVWVILRRLPRLNAATRYGIWWLTLIVVVALPLFGFDALERPVTPVAATAVAEAECPPVYAMGDFQRVKLAPAPKVKPDIREANGTENSCVAGSQETDAQREDCVVRAVATATIEPSAPAVSEPQSPASNSITDDAPSCAPATTTDDELQRPGMFASTWSTIRSTATSGWNAVASFWESPYEIPVGRIASIALLALAGVCALFVARLVWCYARLVSLKRNSLPLPARRQQILERLLCNRRRARRVSLRHSNGIRVPTALGLFNPVILFPTDLLAELTESEFENIVYHEYAHICRRDDWTNLLQRIIEAVFVFHPAVRIIGGQLCLQREIACDDWVIAITGRTRSYAVCLTKLVTLTPWTRRYMPAPSMLRTKSQFTRRIETLLNRRRNATPRVSNVAVLVAAIALFTIFFQIGRVPAVVAVFDPIQNLRDNPAPVVLEAAPVRYHVTPAPTATALACTEVAYPSNRYAIACATAPVVIATPRPAAFAYTVASPAVVSVPDRVEWADATGDCASTSGGVYGLNGFQVFTKNTNFDFWSFADSDPMTFAVEYPNGDSESISYGQLIRLLAMGVTGEYVRSMRESGLQDITIPNLVALRQSGVTADYVEEMSEAGLSDLTVKDVIALRSNGVRPEDVSQYRSSGMDPISVNDMIKLRNSGVSGDYTAALSEAGFDNLSPRDVAMLRANGVSADYLAALGESGLDVDNLGDVIGLRCNGVSADFVKAVMAYGLDDVAVDDIIGLRANGVTEEFLDGLRDADVTGLSAIDLIGMRANGVSPDFIAAARSYGLTDSDVRDIVIMRRSGISASFLEALHDLDPAAVPLRPEELAGLRANGATPELIAKMREMWGDEISARDMIGMRANGVSNDYLDELAQAGLTDLSPRDVIELRANGVSAVFAGAVLGHDFSESVDVDDIIALRANGVTADYLDDVSTLKMALSVDDVIDLRSNGVDAKFIGELNDLDLKDLTVDQIIQLRALGLSPKNLSRYRDARGNSH